MGRNSQGVRGISLREKDKVVAMVVVKRGGTLLAISENGFGKRSDVEHYKQTRRGSKGVITLKTTDRNGYLISLMEVVDNDDLMIVTKNGMIIRQAVEKISVIGRNTQGVRLINLNKGDKVFDITRILAEQEEEIEEIEENNEGTDTESIPTDDQLDEKKEEIKEVPVEPEKQPKDIVEKTDEVPIKPKEQLEEIKVETKKIPDKTEEESEQESSKIEEKKAPSKAPSSKKKKKIKVDKKTEQIELLLDEDS